MKEFPPIEPIAGIVLLALILTAPYLNSLFDTGSDELGPTYIEWHLTTFNETWRIKVDAIRTINASNVSFGVDGPRDCLPKIDDPSGFPVPMMGDLDDAAFSQAAFNASNLTFGDYFHSRDPDGLRNRNITLFIVFVDVDGDGSLSSGDEIWMRDCGQSGPCTDEADFVLVNREVNKAYGRLPLPKP